MIETMQQKNLRFDLDFILQKGYFFVLSLKKNPKTKKLNAEVQILTI